MQYSSTLPQPDSKPWYRLRNIALAVAVLVLCGIGWLGLTAVRMANAKPGTAINFAAKFQELADKHRPAEGTNAHPLVMALTAERERLEAVHAENGARAIIYYDAIEPAFSVPPSQTETSTAESERAKVVQILSQYPSSTMPKLWEQVIAAPRFERALSGGPLVLEMLPELGSMRGLARMNGARMYHASKTDNHAELVRAYEQSLALARLVAQDPVLISHLVSIAIRAKAGGDLRKILIEERLPLQTIDELIAVAGRQAIKTPRSLGFQGEQLMFEDFVQRTHSDDGRGSGRMLMGPAAKLAGAAGGPMGVGLPKADAFNVLALGIPSKRRTLIKGRSYYDLVVEQMDLPRPGRDPAKVDRLYRFHDTLGTTDFVLKLLMPAMSKAFQSMDQADVDVAGTRLMLEIERFRAINGHLPESLAELPAAVTTDPFTAKAFGYRTLTPPDADGRDYLLYSLGLDGVDNQGEHDPKNIFAALNKPAAAGSDFPINLPRETVPGK